MGKRKRTSHEDQIPGERNSDVGLGATLSSLNRNEDDDMKMADCLDSNDEGWTVVGAHKKRQKHSGRDNRSYGRHGSLPLRHKHQRRRDSSSLEPDAVLEDYKPSNERSTGPTEVLRSYDNPFASKDKSSEEQLSRPNNPFSTERRAERAGETVTSTNASTDLRGSKLERGKERKLDRHYPAIEHAYHARLNSHVKIADLQSLALYILADGPAPQWVSVQSRASIRQVVILMVPGLELSMFNGKLALEASSSDGGSGADADDKGTKPKRLHVDPDDYYPAELKPNRLTNSLKPLSEIFSHVWPIQAPGEYRNNQFIKVHSPIHTMLTSQVPRTREERQLKKSAGHKGPTPQNTKHWQNKRTPVTEYLLSLPEQVENEYVLHPAWFSSSDAKEAAYQARKAANQSLEDGWVDSKVTTLKDGQVPKAEVESGSITHGRRIIALDCEMCKAGNESVLTRVSLLDWDGSVLLDKLVKPDVTITDYLTQWSGITEAMLRDVTTTLSDIQGELLDIITPRTILVGHSLNSDLNALKLTHPFLIDTGILFPHQRGPPYKQSLKWLTQKYLQTEIQKGVKGHDSVEDARACLNLVKQKCERGPQWGTSETNAESIFKRLGRTCRPGPGDDKRSGAVVDWGDPTRGHGSQAQVAVGCESDSDVVNGIERTLKGSAVGKDGAAERIDFVWGRLRELELARGWWDNGRTSEDVELIRQAALKRLGLPTEGDEEVEVTGVKLGDAVSRTVDHIVQIYESLPRCTALIVYSGTGDPREVRRLQNMQQQHRLEYRNKKWDELSVKWTDTEVQALSKACKAARNGVGFITVK
jgi:RNA exonuclease 1